jgi:hypothetical protein
MLYKLFKERIPVLEFLDLISSDKNWTIFASKDQFKKILGLFDQTYGF